MILLGGFDSQLELIAFDIYFELRIQTAQAHFVSPSSQCKINQHLTATALFYMKLTYSPKPNREDGLDVSNKQTTALEINSVKKDTFLNLAIPPPHLIARLNFS